MGNELPNKLKHDAIVEATFEMRFDPDPSTIPEVLIGRLADTGLWKGFQQRRLPGADIPSSFRRADPNLRYQPSIELLHPSGVQRVGIGPNSIGFTRAAPYPGWNEKFGEEVTSTVDTLFDMLPSVPVTRLGLRYINALTSSLHGIRGIASLNLRIKLGDEVLTQKLNLNYTVPVLTESSCTVRVASADLAQGSIPPNATVIADLDVYTNEGYQESDRAKVKAWCTDAHQIEKVNFFRLLDQTTIDRLRLG